MAIETTCPSCGRVQTYSPEGLGKKGRCRACRTAYKIGEGTRWSPRRAGPRPSETLPLILPAADGSVTVGCSLCGADADPSTYVGGICPACHEEQTDFEPEGPG